MELLADENDAVRRAARSELERAGRAAVPALRRGSRSGNARLRSRARAVLADRGLERARRRLLAYATGGEIDLERALCLLSALDRPRFDARPYRKTLDAFAAAVRKEAGTDEPSKLALTLVRYLGKDIGFRGENEDYHHPQNIFLHRAIETRRGMPLTLTAIYQMVARRLGVSAGALPLPGHVLLRLHAGDRSYIVDTFHGGRFVSHQSCVDYVVRHQLEPNPAWFRDTTDHVLFLRQVRNLIHSLRLRGLNRDAGELKKLERILSAHHDPSLPGPSRARG